MTSSLVHLITLRLVQLSLMQLLAFSSPISHPVSHLVLYFLTSGFDTSR